MKALKDSVSAASPLAHLVAEPAKRHVGFVAKMSYSEAVLVTNDSWRDRVGGLPINSILIATAFDPLKYADAPDSEKAIVVLRTRESAALPIDVDNFKAIVDHHQSHDEVLPKDPFDGIEPITHAQLQYSGISCRVLGTFFDVQGTLHFGADVEDFQSLSHLRVYKPTPEALEAIVNYVEPMRVKKAEDDAKRMGFAAAPKAFEIGYVRYTSTDRLQRASPSVPVRVHPSDFLARRTAVLGMTRTGKSNTVKTMVAAVSLAAGAAGVRIGQIIFDMNGEYANANKQDDGSSLAEVFDDNTVRYRGLPTPGFFDLRNNFYHSLDSGLEVLQEAVREQFSGNQPDQQAFLSLTLQEPPNDPREQGPHLRWEKLVVLYRLLLWKADFDRGAFPDRLQLKVGQKALSDIYQGLDRSGATNEKDRADAIKVEFGDPESGLTFSEMETFLQAARRAHNALVKNDGGGGKPKVVRTASNAPWFDPTALSLANLLARENSNGGYINGWNVLSGARQFHSPHGSKSVPHDVYEHLTAGRIVILDLSVGSEKVRKTLAEKVAAHILGKSSATFNQAKEPPSIVIYVEEAHNLIGKDEDFDKTWPRIAKEGAKFRIALAYSTQEPSSVHPNILANTENWFVSHLNNDQELKTLGRFYDFADFSDSLKVAQNVGFARIKTLSAPYVVPTQIKEFKPSDLKPIYASLPRPKGFEPAPKPAKA